MTCNILLKWDFIADAASKKGAKKKGGSFQTVSALFRVRAELFSPVPIHCMCRTYVYIYTAKGNFITTSGIPMYTKLSSSSRPKLT